MTPIEHIVTCRSGCVIDDLRFCPDVPAEWAEQYRARAETLRLINEKGGE